MRPTGRLHLGHYHGVLKNWVELQHEYDCYFFVADWHALAIAYVLIQFSELHGMILVRRIFAAARDPDDMLERFRHLLLLAKHQHLQP